MYLTCNDDWSVVCYKTRLLISIETRKRTLGGGGNFPHPSRPALGPPSLLYNGYLVISGGKVAGAWLWSLTPSSAEVKQSTGLGLPTYSIPEQRTVYNSPDLHILAIYFIHTTQELHHISETYSLLEFTGSTSRSAILCSHRSSATLLHTWLLRLLSYLFQRIILQWWTRIIYILYSYYK
jgi:hypothetical protein